MSFDLSPRQVEQRSYLNDSVSLLDGSEERILRDLTVIQQAALVQMRESQVKRAVVARLLEECQDKPRVSDYEALVTMGLAEKGAADKWHKLTYQGRRISGHLEARLCARFQIHLLAESGSDRFNVSFRCCCGWKTQVPKQSPSVWRNARARFARHEGTAEGIRELRAAMKPRPLQETA